MQLKASALLLFLFANVHILYSQQQVTFSVQAHPDDWQLFMSNKITGELNAGDKVVFITLTAGDAGNGSGGYGSPIAFFQARENGSVYSAKFSADLLITNPLFNPPLTTTVVNGHSMVKYVYLNTVNYFLHLPDGGGLGEGNPITGFTSLQKLKDGVIPSITAVDNLTTYTSWADLTATIMKIITIERGLDDQVWIHTPSLDEVLNPTDHSDHLMSGLAAQEAVEDSLWVGINEFIDYASASLPANLTNSQHSDASAIFATAVWGLTESKYAGTFEPGHQSWLPMEYFVIKRVPEGVPANLVNRNMISLSSANPQTMLTTIPMTTAVTKYKNDNSKNLQLVISPYQTGSLQTTVTDMRGLPVYSTVTYISNKRPLVVPLNLSAALPGTYKVKNVLNNKYIEFKNITVR